MDFQRRETLRGVRRRSDSSAKCGNAPGVSWGVYVGGFHGASSRRSHRGSCCSLGTRLGDITGAAPLAWFFLGDSFLEGVVAIIFVVADRQGDVPEGKNGNQYS
mmetsp:Transcript_12077/g.25952  ORF Transcript_12077/g.25952 Transcript_12077/m.25952 type:complete len:104 (-) Transcript_12077:375-686(-)